MNVELSEAEPLPARSEQRRRRIRRTFTSDELDARSHTKHSIAMLVLWDDIGMREPNATRSCRVGSDEVGETLRNGQQKRREASLEASETALSLSLGQPASGARSGGTEGSHPPTPVLFQIVRV